MNQISWNGYIDIFACRIVMMNRPCKDMSFYWFTRKERERKETEERKKERTKERERERESQQITWYPSRDLQKKRNMNYRFKRKSCKKVNILFCVCVKRSPMLTSDREIENIIRSIMITFIGFEMTGILVAASSDADVRDHGQTNLISRRSDIEFE